MAEPPEHHGTAALRAHHRRHAERTGGEVAYLAWATVQCVDPSLR